MDATSNAGSVGADVEDCGGLVDVTACSGEIATVTVIATATMTVAEIIPARPRAHRLSRTALTRVERLLRSAIDSIGTAECLESRRASVTSHIGRAASREEIHE